ncbi:MAG: 3-isopropylmalate dehydratase large subunit [Phycisphaeraceae bacterium]
MTTLYEKLVQRHTVTRLSADEVLLYVSFHIMNEYTSPQAFSGLHSAGRAVWRPQSHLGVVDHVNSTRRPGHGENDNAAQLLIENFIANCNRHGIRCFDHTDPRQGIEHVVVPEQGLARPGQVIACGDSHTTTYGAFGALGFGIGTSEVEHVLATQTLVYRILKPMRVTLDGCLPPGVTAKDLIMHVIRTLGVSSAVGYAVEFAGGAITSLDMAGRMTVCNMATEMGARAALIAPDQTVLGHLKNRPLGPTHEQLEQLHQALPVWRSDDDAAFAKEHHFDASDIAPLVTWGTTPEQAIPIDGTVPILDELPAARRNDAARALAYMGLVEGQPLHGVPIDMAFIGSCTNSRIEDLRAAADVVASRHVAPGIHAIVVPGSRQVLLEAEREGLADVFRAAGFDWRGESGCSMCLAMNDDVAGSGVRIASSTNRNFEGRQGRGARTHLMSPAMVAAAAVTGHITDVRDLAAVAHVS